MAETTRRTLLYRDNPWHLAEGKDEGAMWLAWLVRLRWVAIFSQLIALAFSLSVIDGPFVTVPILLSAVVGLGFANLAALRTLDRAVRVEPDVLLIHLGIDLSVLTAFFYAAGGTTNPFVMLYVVHVAMAAVMMPRRFAVAVLGAVILCNGLLHAFFRPLHLDQHTIPSPALIALGQTIAFTVTVVSVAAFILGMAATLRRQKQRLIEARDRTARTDRLRSVGTLAAGAAHELNTPLSTMGLRLRRIKRRHEDPDTARDVEVIHKQLERCSGIVQQLLVGAGDPSASDLGVSDLDELVAETLKLWSKGSTIEAVHTRADSPAMVELPTIAFRQALINLLENARQAQEEIGCFDPLRIEVMRDDVRATVRVFDKGPGIEEIERVGEPFYTTKPTGTGLGVFVARSLADGAGGGLRYERDNDTTITRWWFPISGRNG
jgi:two-component system sensor histidine kinase RegB